MLKRFISGYTEHMPLNIPNLLTWLRILLIPVFVTAFYLSDDTLSPHLKNLLSTGVFLLAAVTDWLDGYLARKLNQSSAFGAFLDPVADKLMVAAALIVLVKLGRADAIIAFIIIGREITISALREWMAKLGESKSVAVSMLGKIKTTFQMIAITAAAVPRAPAGHRLPDDWLVAAVSCRVADLVVDGLLPDAGMPQIKKYLNLN